MHYGAQPMYTGRTMTHSLLVSGLLLAGVVSTGQAVPLLEILDLGPAARPFSARTTSSPFSAYFHPASLKNDRVRFDLSLVTLSQRHSVRRMPRPDGYDVENTIYRAEPIASKMMGPNLVRPLPTDQLPGGIDGSHRHSTTGTSLIVGGHFPVVPGRLALGLLGVVPVGFLQTQRPNYVDERSQFFEGRLMPERYGDRLESAQVAFSTSLKVVDGLKVGVGVLMTNHAFSRPLVYVPDAANQEATLTGAEVEVTPAVAPIGSILLETGGMVPLDLSLTMHGPSENRLKGRGQLRFWEFDYPEGQDFLNQSFDQVFQWRPWRVGGGLATRLSVKQVELDVSLSVLWSQWSAYRNRQGERPSDWSDTVDIKASLTPQFGSHEFGLGIGYFPTPVPEQSGRTNYVDTSRLALQAGYGYELIFQDQSIRIGIGLQGQRLTERTHVKRLDARAPVRDEFPDSVDLQTGAPIAESSGLQTNNIGFPGFDYDGWLWATMFQIGIGL